MKRIACSCNALSKLVDSSDIQVALSESSKHQFSQNRSSQNTAAKPQKCTTCPPAIFWNVSPTPEVSACLPHSVVHVLSLAVRIPVPLERLDAGCTVVGCQLVEGLTLDDGCGMPRTYDLFRGRSLSESLNRCPSFLARNTPRVHSRS